MIRRPPRSTLFPYTTPSDLGHFGHLCGRLRQPQVLEHQLGGEARLEAIARSEEHTSELQSQSNLVCRLLLEKKKKKKKIHLKKIHCQQSTSFFRLSLKIHHI